MNCCKMFMYMDFSKVALICSTLVQLICAETFKHLGQNNCATQNKQQCKWVMK